MGIWDGEGASRPTPRVTWSPESREELERVQAVPRLSAGFVSVRLQTLPSSWDRNSRAVWLPPGQLLPEQLSLSLLLWSPSWQPSCLLPKAFNRVGERLGAVVRCGVWVVFEVCPVVRGSP